MRKNIKTLSAVSIAALSLSILGCAADKTNTAQKGGGLDFGKSPAIPTSYETDKDGVMTKAYWDIWNKDVQKAIDERIEKFRKSDAKIALDAAPNSPVKVRHVSHKFFFGAHIFNFNQLGKKEYNDIYKSLYNKYDGLFNSATVAFYWKCFEMEFDKPRFETEYWDTEEFWENVKYPKLMPHWRRPPTDEVVDFCKSKNLRIHGHPLIWADRGWHYPELEIWKKYGTTENVKFKRYAPHVGRSVSGYVFTKKYTDSKIEDLEKEFGAAAKGSAERSEIRVREIAKRYGDKIDSWDVVNESARDFSLGNLPSKSKLITRSRYGIMEADYDFNAFRLAQKYLPEKARLNINDYFMEEAYLKQILSLKQRGCKIDVVGSQMHLFDPKQTLDISKGAKIQTPEQVGKVMDMLSKAGCPIHLSEITITAAGTSDKERMMQAVALRNLYRMWFSVEKMNGITWWNVVDDCGAPGEPSMSGLFTRDMKPKPAFFAMNNLINGEWKTNLDAKADADGALSFRGFKGEYEISYTDKNGKQKTIKYTLN